MEPVRMTIVGCGGMGRRHLAGLGELRKAGDTSIDLVAVCDLNQENARDLADEAASMLGTRPVPFASVGDMANGMSDLEAADCTTDTGSHHIVATELLRLGINTLVEKPIALTVRGAHQVIDAAQESGAILSVAENYRRDPMNRLVKALLDDGAIGEPQLMVETSIGGRDAIFITPWRHQKLTGTITLDAGVHNADMLSYFFGDVASAYGQTRLHHPTRYKGDTAGPGGFYEKWAAAIPDSISATGEDAIDGLLTFANGAVGHWIQNHAGHGQAVRSRMLFGSAGSITAPDDRSGKPVSLTRDSGETVSGEGVLPFAPSYRLEPMAATLFRGERPATYAFDFPTTDRNLIALEQYELAQCIRTGAAPEVGARQGLHALAIVHAVFESQEAGRAVSLAEVERGELTTYQDEIDAHYGLTGAATR